MGINSGLARLLVRARRQGDSFDKVVTVGRQSLALPEHELLEFARELDLEGVERRPSNLYADTFLGDYLGARTIHAIDYSDYQQADIVHDLNQPLPAGLAGSFDALIDGGSLEHIFDIRQVLCNYMQLVRIGGSIFINTTANNLCGHGFYQFSPEFFYRVFEPTNGFQIRDMLLVESPLLMVEKSARLRYYSVRDPAQVGKRVQLVNKRPTMILVHATRISDRPPFALSPLQSDYSDNKWHKNQKADGAGDRAREREQPGFEYLPRWEELRRRFRQWRKNSRHNRRFFQTFRF